MRRYRVARRIIDLLRSADPHLIAIAMTLFFLVLHIMIIGTPWPEDLEACRSTKEKCSFVFDEAHYVPAVREMIAGRPANNEHPPLSKWLMMLGISLLGDSPYGWRISSVITGTLSVYVLYRLATLLLGSGWAGLAAAFLYAADVTSFNLSSIAVLDPPANLFLLLSAYLLLREKRLLAGIAMGLALLTKASAVFGVGALLLFELLRSARGSDWAERLYNGVVRSYVLLIVSAAVTLSGLAIYDAAYNAFPNPFAHLDFILSYHSSLTFNCLGGMTPFACVHVNQDGSNVTVDLPLSWTLPGVTFQPMGFYVVTVSVDGSSYRPIAYYGMAAPLWWTSWVVMVFFLVRGIAVAWRQLSGLGEAVSTEHRLDLLLACWFVMNYLVYFPLAHLLHRWVYPFYFFQVMPLLAIGAVRLLLHGWFERKVLYLLLAVTAFWFFAYYPVKSDLHIQLLRSLGLPA
jgi:4-amino-4-deoxy-L-arabinose transferase-like glycosyltransferase